MELESTRALRLAGQEGHKHPLMQKARVPPSCTPSTELNAHVEPDSLKAASENRLLYKKVLKSQPVKVTF